MRASFYEKDITPPLGCYLAGYYIHHVAEDVLDTLHVRAAVFESDGVAAVVLSIDSCELPDDLHDAVTKRIFDYTGIPAEQVLVSVNHTHKGIPITDSPELNAYADAAFKDVVYRLIADCAILAYRRLYPATAYFACGTAEGVSFNRNFVTADGRYVTFGGTPDLKPLAGVDTDLPIIFVKDGDGRPRGAVVSFACHQDCLPVSHYTGDYSHALANELKKTYGADFITVFLPGTCGDINHIDPTQKSMPFDTYLHIGKTLADAVRASLATAEPIGEGVAVVKRQIPLTRRMMTEQEAAAEIAKFAEEGRQTAIRNLTYYRSCVKTPETQAYVQGIRLGDVMLYGYPGEVYVNFGLDLKKRSPFKKNMVATLCNTGCGYIVTREGLSKQSRLYEKALCLGACLDENAGYTLTDELLNIAKELKV